jgi:hypothetical protein
LGADLRGTQLIEASLLGIWINDRTIFDETTILPDGTRYTCPEDLTKFIDGTWKPDWLDEDSPWR